MKLEIILLATNLLGQFQITAYRSVPEQTDSSPFHTSIGEHVCGDGIAVSQDLIASGRVKYGDWLYVEEIGFKRVNDVMNKRHINRLDIWVPSWLEEHKFHQKFKQKKLKVWKVKRAFNETKKF